MRKQLHFEDVQVGDQVPPLSREVSNEMLVRYAAASNDYHRHHYDHLYATSRGWKTVIAHGPLGTSFLMLMLSDWIGEDGWLRRIDGTYRAPAYPGDTVFAKGTVTKKYVQDGEHRVDLDVWIENQDGMVCTPGTATVVLPARGGQNREND